VNAPIETKASDRYLTPQHIRDLVELVWGDVPDLDPFHDPEGGEWAREAFDIREGDDAYLRAWFPEGNTVWVNGPYSGKHPAKTAERIAREVSTTPGIRILNLCPAAIGSDYWARYVWPRAQSVACLGRLAFVAAVDMYDSKGRLVCPAGKAANGNRTEIALVNYSAQDDRAFRQIFSRAGYPVLRHA